MSIFLETVKGIFSQNNPPKPNAKPLFNPATGRALQAWAGDARALTAGEAEALHGVWMGAQVGDLILPTYDVNGAIVGARLWTQEGTRLAPRADSGLATTGAVLANRSGRAWLGGKISEPACILIAEGEPDFVVLCLLAEEMERRYPGYVYVVLGIYSGAWSRGFGAKITMQSTVAICTDKDKAGEGYAGLIRASIERDVEVTRWAGFGDNDIEECAKAGLDLIALIFEQSSEMPAPPTQDEGRWGWTDAGGWTELPAWAAAREAEKAWAAAQAIPREALGDALLERARKYCDAKLAAVAQELEGLDGDRTRALQIMAPIMSLVAGGALERAAVEGELVAAYVSGDKETRKDRHTQILTALKSGPGGRPREAITLEDIAAKLKIEDDERAREAEARKKREKQNEQKEAKSAPASTPPTTTPAAETSTDMEGILSVEEWHREVDGQGWERNPSEMELAHRLLDYLTPPGFPSPVADEGTLWRYSVSRGVWVDVSPAQVSRIIDRWDAQGTGDKKKIRITEKAGKAARNLAMHLVEDVGFFSNAPRGVMLRSEFVRVDPVKRTVVIEPPSPDHRARHKLDASPSAPGDLLRGYLASAHDGPDAQEKVELMGQVAFSALAGLGTVLKKAVLLYGEKGTGKSQFLRLVQGLVPRAAQCTIDPQRMGEDYHCAALASKTLNVVMDLEADEFLKEGRLKAVVHGEPVQARQPRGEVFQLWPIALHLFSANNLPAAPGVSPAFWDRWLVVGFEKAWTGEARAASEGAVQDIAERILETDLGGVLQWAIDCGRRLVANRNGYAIPESSRRLMREWQAEGDSVAAWLEDRATILPRDTEHSSCCKAMTAYEDYKYWTDQNNYRPVNARKFKSRLQTCGVRALKSSVANLYFLRLKSQHRD